MTTPDAQDGSNYRNFIAATAGHIDHGKSSLVQALTGTDPDRLPEEKRRGITIELGFAHLELPVDQRDLTLRVGIVDVPGHEDFVKNMVAGAGAADIALLVVAANEGWMPQTEEHLQIVEYLGARSGVIVLTKADLVADPAPRIAEVRAAVAGGAFAESPIVPVSVVDRSGIDTLRQAIAARLLALPPAPAAGTPRLAVDRAFAVAGAGTVVTGTLSGGNLQRGQEVEAWPGGTRARIRAMECFNRSADRAGPATRIALNLAASGSARTAGPPRRGDLVTTPGSVTASSYLDARISRSRRAGSERAAAFLRGGLRVRVHHGTANIAATIRLHAHREHGGLAAGASALARIHLDEPRAMLVGDRFVVRDWSQRHTLAGGEVLDPAPRRPLRDRVQRAQLQAVGAAPRQTVAVLLARASADGVLELADLARLVPAGLAGVERAAQDLAAHDRIRMFDRFAADAEWFAARVTAAAEAIEADLRAHPERSGVPVTALHAALAPPAALPRRAAAALRDAVLGALMERGFRRSAALIRPPGHTAALPANLTRAAKAVRATLAEAPLSPPSRGQLAADPDGQAVLQYLVSSGEVVQIDRDVVLPADAFEEAQASVIAYLRRNGSATTGALRTAVGTNRRVIIPLLERLDRDGVTLRIGNERRLAATDT
jgi:selenocysteine-specific elongation factor